MLSPETVDEVVLCHFENGRLDIVVEMEWVAGWARRWTGRRIVVGMVRIEFLCS